MDVLGYRMRPFPPGHQYQSYEFAEWLINDMPLAALLVRNPDASAPLSPFPGKIPPTNWCVDDVIEQLCLRSPTEMESGRYIILSCAFCGDRWCGTTTVAIQRADDEIIWSDFGSENPTWAIDDDADEWMLDIRPNVGPFHFSFAHYETTLRAMARDGCAARRRVPS